MVDIDFDKIKQAQQDFVETHHLAPVPRKQRIRATLRKLLGRPQPLTEQERLQSLIDKYKES